MRPAARPRRLRRSVELFPAPGGEIYLLRTDGEPDVLIENASPEQRAVLERLAAGPVDDAEPDLLEALEEVEVLEETAAGRTCLSTEELERFDRQLAYFADRTRGGDAPYEMQERLRDATVAIVGVGGLGSWAAAGLACAGVGRLVLIDDDMVELSNLNRQVLYRRSDVGRPKVDAAADFLGGFTPEQRVERRRDALTAENATGLLAGADFVIETADRPVHLIGRWIDVACRELGVPHISAGQFPPLVRVGPTFVPGRTACVGCQEAGLRDEFVHYDELVRARQRNGIPAATLGPASGLIGSIIAMEILHHLTGIAEPATLGAALIVDLRTYAVDRQPVTPRADCSECAAGQSQPRSVAVSTA